MALVERELVGGECSYWACIPSKALLRPGEALGAARRVPAVASAITGDIGVDAALRSRDVFVHGFDDEGQADWLQGIGVDLIRGHARLAGERTVEVDRDGGDTVTVEARNAVVLATGTRASIPPIEGVGDIEIWDSRDVTTANRSRVAC